MSILRLALSISHQRLIIAMNPPKDPHFPKTSWTLFARVRSKDASVAADALSEICNRYRYPLYCYLRRRGLDHPDAEDVLHDFLLRLIRTDSFASAEESKGRLRGYLSTALDRHRIHWRERRTRRPAPLGGDGGELLRRYGSEAFHTSDTPDLAYERAWAITIIHASLDRQADRYRRRGKSALFETLRPVILEGGSLRGHDSAALAASLSMTEDALRAALHRMLKEYGGHLQAEVAETVANKEEIEPEIRHLLRLFSSS